MFYLFSFVFLTSFVIIIYLFLIGYKRSIYNFNHQIVIDDVENKNHKYFVKVVKIIIKYFVKRVIKYYNFATHYILFVILKIVNIFNNLGSMFYTKLRDYFIVKSVKDKSYIKFFWKSLKEYKKERDDEMINK